MITKIPFKNNGVNVTCTPKMEVVFGDRKSVIEVFIDFCVLLYKTGGLWYKRNCLKMDRKLFLGYIFHMKNCFLIVRIRNFIEIIRHILCLKKYSNVDSRIYLKIFLIIEFECKS